MMTGFLWPERGARLEVRASPVMTIPRLNSSVDTVRPIGRVYDSTIRCSSSWDVHKDFIFQYSITSLSYSWRGKFVFATDTQGFRACGFHFYSSSNITKNHIYLQSYLIDPFPLSMHDHTDEQPLPLFQTHRMIPAQRKQHDTTLWSYSIRSSETSYILSTFERSIPLKDQDQLTSSCQFLHMQTDVQTSNGILTKQEVTTESLGLELKYTFRCHQSQNLIMYLSQRILSMGKNVVMIPCSYMCVLVSGSILYFAKA